MLNDIIVVRRATRGVTHYMGLARGMRDLYWSQSQAAHNLELGKFEFKIKIEQNLWNQSQAAVANWKFDKFKLKT